MPTYVHRCENGHRFERVRRVADFDKTEVCDCGLVAPRVICAPMVFVQPDICYDSPIDGRPITSMQARLEDLARAECVPYDPGMKQDYQRRIARGEAELEAKIEATVEAEIERMPTEKRERLHNEMLGGMEAVPERRTADIRSTVTLDQAG